MLEDGSTLYKSELLAELGVEDKELEESGLVIQERDTTRTEIKWYKVSGSEVLEQTTFPGRFIPVIPVYGEVNDIENERFIFSLVHFAKTPQRLYNYWKSTEAHILQKLRMIFWLQVLRVFLVLRSSGKIQVNMLPYR